MSGKIARKSMERSERLPKAGIALRYFRIFYLASEVMKESGK